MNKSRKRNVITGVAWFNQEQWTLLKKVATDKNGLHDTYDEWVVDVNSIIVQLEQTGVECRQVPVNVAELVDWCNEQKIPIDGQARSQFAAKKLEESFTN